MNKEMAGRFFEIWYVRNRTPWWNESLGYDYERRLNIIRYASSKSEFPQTSSWGEFVAYGLRFYYHLGDGYLFVKTLSKYSGWSGYEFSLDFVERVLLFGCLPSFGDLK